MPEKKEETTTAAAEATATTAPKVRKAKSFKRIRGFLTGETRKQRKARKEAEAKKKAASSSAKENEGSKSKSAATTTLNNVGTALDTDDSTIYGVQVDERSTSTNSILQNAGDNKNMLSTSLDDATKPESSKSSSGYLLKLVLLLMDPETRRFELLQLEFDSNKAMVADVLAQIPLSVTEEALRAQVYTGVTGREGKEKTSTELLSTFCGSGNDVLVAVPQGLPAKECARLAKPILSDSKVISMLTSSGIDPKAWKEKSKKSRSSSKTGASKDKGGVAVDKSSSGSSGSKVNKIFGLILFLGSMKILHMYFSAPIQPGHVVSPGIQLRKCGVFGIVPGMAKALGPRVCTDNLSMKVEEDKVSMYDGDDKLVWILHGNKCAESAEGCVNGLEFTNDKTLAMAGKPIKWLETFGPTELAPWPFAEEPVIKTWKGSNRA